MVPISRECSAAGARRFLLHDERALDAGLEPVQLALLNALAEPLQLVERHVQGFLRSLCRSSGVTKHARPVALRVQRSVYGIAQATLLAHFGEQPRAGAA